MPSAKVQSSQIILVVISLDSRKFYLSHVTSITNKLFFFMAPVEQYKELDFFQQREDNLSLYFHSFPIGIG